MNETGEFDKAALEALMRIARDSEDLHLLLGEFVSSTRERISAIRGTSDGDTIRRLAHPMKSGASTIGATGFAQLCREIEQACQQGNPAEAIRLATSLETEFARVMDWLQTEAGYPAS